MFLFSEKRGQASALGKEPAPGRPCPTLTTNGAEGDKNDHSHDSRQHASPHALTKAPLITGMPSPAEGPEPGPTPHHGKPVPFSLRKETRPQLPLRGVVLDGVGARSRIDDHASSLRPRSRTKDSLARRASGKGLAHESLEDRRRARGDRGRTARPGRVTRSARAGSVRHREIHVLLEKSDVACVILERVEDVRYHDSTITIRV